MKKLVLILVFANVIVGGIFSQEKSANIRNNWISGEVNILGGGVRYERMLNEHVSLGVNVYYSTLFFFWNEFGVDAAMRLYPSGKAFYFGLNAGYHVHSAITADSDNFIDVEAMDGGAFTPEIGWKIDVGRPGGFFIQPGIKVPITLGMKEKAIGDREFGVGVGVVPYFGLGGAF